MTTVSPLNDQSPIDDILQPWQLFVVILAIWINRHQQRQLEFQRAQIQVLLELLGKKRLLLTDDQRRRLAVQGKAVRRKALMELATIVTPDTILRWHRVGDQRSNGKRSNTNGVGPSTRVSYETHQRPRPRRGPSFRPAWACRGCGRRSQRGRSATAPAAGGRVQS